MSKDKTCCSRYSRATFYNADPEKKAHSSSSFSASALNAVVPMDALAK